jgi:hypothetical protein
MHRLAKGKSKLKSYKGWTHQSPDGDRVIIANLKAFCNEWGLSPVHMLEVKAGKRRNHKGWTWREDEN